MSALEMPEPFFAIADTASNAIEDAVSKPVNGKVVC